MVRLKFHLEIETRRIRGTMSLRLESYMVTVVSWLLICSNTAGVREAQTRAETKSWKKIN